MTKKKTIWFVTALLVLVLILIGGTYSCQKQKERGHASHPERTKTATSKNPQKKENSDTLEEIQETGTVPSEVVQADKNQVPDSVPKKNATIDSDKPANSNDNSNSASKPAHTHEWKLHTESIYHEEEGHFERVLVKAAWVEEIPQYKTVEYSVCNLCRQEIVGEEPWKHGERHALAGEGAGGHHSEFKAVPDGVEKVSHPAEYQDKWVVDKKAYTEKKNSYRCECGVSMK